VFKALAEVNDGESAAEIFRYFLKGKYHQGRIAAVKALGRLRKDDKHLAEELLVAQNFPDASIRQETASVIEEIGSKENLDSLLNWLNSEPEGRVRRRIREAIYTIESKSTVLSTRESIVSPEKAN
jgi:HEAT repeat protein